MHHITFIFIFSLPHPPIFSDRLLIIVPESSVFGYVFVFLLHVRELVFSLVFLIQIVLSLACVVNLYLYFPPGGRIAASWLPALGKSHIRNRRVRNRLPLGRLGHLGQTR